MANEKPLIGVPVDLPLLDPRGRPLHPDDLLAATGDGGWQRRPVGQGTKGVRDYDWGRARGHG